MFMKFTPSRSSVISKNEDYYVDLSAEEQTFKDYIKREGDWSIYNNKEEVEKQFQNHEMANIVNKLIDHAYPPKPIPQNNDIHISNLPLKMTFVGNKLSGKSTMSQKLSEKYGLALIDPTKIVKEALDLAKPPPAEDPKKAGKKDSKKP